jgi:hypothetical protein
MSEVGASCKGDPRHPVAVLSQPLLALVLPVVIPGSHHLRRVPGVPGTQYATPSRARKRIGRRLR